MDNLKIVGNYIGIDAAGETALVPAAGETDQGIVLYDTDSGLIIGGQSEAERNLLDSGLEIDNQTDALIQGNFVGTDKAGTTPRCKRRSSRVRGKFGWRDRRWHIGRCGERIRDDLCGSLRKRHAPPLAWCFKEISSAPIAPERLHWAPVQVQATEWESPWETPPRTLWLAARTRARAIPLRLSMGMGFCSTPKTPRSWATRSIRIRSLACSPRSGSQPQLTAATATEIDGTYEGGFGDYRLEFFATPVEPAGSPYAASNDSQGKTFLGFENETEGPSGVDRLHVLPNVPLTSDEFITATITPAVDQVGTTLSTVRVPNGNSPDNHSNKLGRVGVHVGEP